MTDDELREAIVQPARLAGCRLEPGLVDLLVRDFLDQPGALPLLSHALVETWAWREANVLTVVGYRDAGAVHGAVAKTAERLYQALPTSLRPAVRALMLRLVATEETGDVIRHPLPMESLTEATEQRAVVDALLEARLVTIGSDALEISHEALARVWPRLQRWLDEDREGQRIRQHISAAADGWERLDREPSELYRGARLRTAIEWARTSGETLTRRERGIPRCGRGARAARAGGPAGAIRSAAREQATAQGTRRRRGFPRVRADRRRDRGAAGVAGQ